MSAGADELLRTSLVLTRTAHRNGWLGSDPYDGLTWGWPAPLLGGRLRRPGVIQAHARCRVDVRRLYRRRPPLIPKTLALFAAAGLGLAELTGEAEPRELA